MTVCIGAISRPMVIVASDRMITSGDIQFEQQQPKIFTIATNTVALISGDIATQTALIESTRKAVARGDIKTVREVARAFSDAYAAYCQRKAEAEVLNPLGIASVDELMAKRRWSADVVRDLLQQVQYAAQSDAAATINSGQDESGPHLYVVDRPGHYSNHDRIGFASVGIGQRHAESQFMLSGYTPEWAFPRAFYLTYLAKKRAEVAPGVGEYTDLAVITAPPVGGVVRLDPDFIPLLDRVYKVESDAIRGTRQQVESELERDLTEFFRVEAARRAPVTPSAPSGPVNPAGQPTPQSSTDDRTDQPPSPE